MYEKKHEPLLSGAAFAGRLLGHFGASLVVAGVSLAGGMAGYARFEHLAWRDAFLNAAMLLGGMGPVDMPQTDGGKVFAGIYALYSGLVFLATAGVMLAPVVHRVLHHFHWEDGPA